MGVDDVGVDMSTDNGGAEGGSAVTPWEVEAGEIDYDKLVKAFGSIIITEVSMRSGGLGETWICMFGDPAARSGVLSYLDI